MSANVTFFLLLSFATSASLLEVAPVFSSEEIDDEVETVPAERDDMLASEASVLTMAILSSSMTVPSLGGPSSSSDSLLGVIASKVAVVAATLLLWLVDEFWSAEGDAAIDGEVELRTWSLLVRFGMATVYFCVLPSCLCSEVSAS